MDATLLVEAPLLRVPFELLGKAFRNAEKLVEKELQALAKSVEELCSRPSGTPAQRADTAAQMDTLLNRANAIRRKLTEINAEQERFLKKLETRMDHLEQMAEAYEANTPERVALVNRVRLDRIIIDHMLRDGYYETAAALAQDANVFELVDLELFAACRKVEESLRSRSCTECLQWCSDNRSKLRKLGSDLEFNLRMQEYIELVRVGKFHPAIAYARKYLSQWMDTHSKDVQKALALLAFPSNSTKCERYRQLYDNSRWQALVDAFRADNFALYSLTSQSLLTITLQAGLSALKTPMCYEDESKNSNCPVCNPPMATLGQPLPYAHHTTSSVVCRMSGAVADADNPPMMLPNGSVYSHKALDAMLQSQGFIIDPRTHEKFTQGDLRKVYIT